MATALVGHADVAKKCNDTWTLYYRHGMNATLSKNFCYNGNMAEARKRAEQHCKIMGYKFIFIRPMICDIESEEAYKLKVGNEGLGELTP